MPAVINTGILEYAVSLHNEYLRYRNSNVPFPAESVAFWCYLLAAQNEEKIEGDLLELGVQHGGTAFLSSLACKEGENQILVDIERTDAFAQKFNTLPERVARRVTFVEASTASHATDWIRSREFRFIHIDAGHTYEAVRIDIERFGGLVQSNGIVCFDDFFTNRWPDVTLAVLDTYQQVGLRPLALVNRKAYFSREESHTAISELLRSNIGTLDAFGTTRVIDVFLRGQALLNIQIAPNANVSKGPL